MPREQFTREQYVKMAMESIQPVRPELRLSPRFDIFHGDSKVSGSAYRITRMRAYHHGTMLLDTDLKVLKASLNSSVKEGMRASGAAVSSVVSSVTNIGCIPGQPNLDHNSFVARLSERFKLEHPESEVIDVTEAQMIEIEGVKSHSEMLNKAEWTLDKTPPFRLNLPRANISVEDGVIVESSNVDLVGEKLRSALFLDLL
jgi:lipoate-protein ligase A